MDIRFEQLDRLIWLIAVIPAALLIAWSIAARRRGLRRFIDAGLVGRLVPQASVGRPVVKGLLVLAALVLLVAAMIDPRWNVTYRPVQQRGVDIMVVLDVSKSMLAEDARPNRLDRARQFIGDLLDALGGDRIGLITFAGTATVRCPLTIDDSAFRLALEIARPESAPRGGSLLGDALRLAADSFTDDVPDHKTIIVFSDGEDHGSYPIEAAARIAQEQEIPIFTVGIGDEINGAEIPLIERGRRRGVVMYDGAPVVTKMDPTVMRQIARESGGAFIPAGIAMTDLGRIYDDRIAPIAKRELEIQDMRLYSPQYQIFAIAALALLLLESFIATAHARGGNR